MQIINTIEIVCAKCGASMPMPIFSPKKDEIRGVFTIEVMPCMHCAKQAITVNQKQSS